MSRTQEPRGAVRMQGHGRVFPPWLDLRDGEARRGTARLRSIDPELIVGRDVRSGGYQVWGPSLHFRGWVAICECRDDHGRLWRGTVPWERVAQSLLEAREGLSSADRAEAHNERLRAEARRREDEKLADAAKFYGRAVAGESQGWGRWSADEVAESYRRQTESQKPAPQGQVVSLPAPRIEVARG